MSHLAQLQSHMLNIKRLLDGGNPKRAFQRTAECMHMRIWSKLRLTQHEPSGGRSQFSASIFKLDLERL